MKKAISFILAVILCLSLCACGKSTDCTCDCPQCALCEQKTHSHAAAETTQETPISAAKQENGNRVVFPEPVLLAEDHKVRIELVSFFEEHSPYKDIGKYIELTFTNQANYEIGVRLKNLAADGSSVDVSYPSAQAPNLLPGETTTYYMEIRDHFKNALASIDLLYTLKGRFEVLRRTGSSTYADAYELPFSVESALSGGSNRNSSLSENSDAWKQFRDYLKEHGPVTVVTDKTDHGQHQVTIEVATGIIHISCLSETTNFYGNTAAHGRSSLQFDLPANVNTVNTRMEFIIAGADVNGGEVQTARPNYTWDIQNYRSGDEISLTSDYTHVDQDGNSIKKPNTVMTLSPTKSFILITDALSQTLKESGLDVTMADLGFTSY